MLELFIIAVIIVFIIDLSGALDSFEKDYLKVYLIKKIED